jgi:RHS repeat-associated protein
MITAPDGSTLSYTYDGSLALSETWGNGPITGTLTRSYNNDFRVTTLGVKGNSVNYQYDDDGLLTQVGHFLLHREVQNGFLTGTTLGNVITQQTLNPFGELESRTATYQGNTLYQVAYQRDKLGRLIQKVETIEGETTTYNYHYNLVGQLVEVFQNGISLNRYDYDDNGNRLALNGVVVGSYDAQDRLVQYGENQYTYTENGELKTKTNTVTHETTSYTYDVFTNLTRVQLPDGTEIEYLIDGRDRRIGKQVNGQLVQGFLYQGSLNPVAELDVNGNLVTRFVYGGRSNVPAYLIKNEQTFRVIADSLGSPRLVVNIATGEIVQRMDYNEFGKVIEDTNPGFQPFGFAGGLYDSDTGLVRFGARDYDPKIGRWTAKDPIDFDGGDANLYGYIWNDPINFADPSGLACGTGACVGIGIGIFRGGQAAYRAYRAYRAARAAQAVQNAIGDDDVPQEDDAETGDTTESAAEQCPDLSGKTRDEARKELEKLGFKDNGTSPGGYEKWYHPDGSRVYIKPDGSISRTGPKIKNPDPNKRGYRPIIGPDGKPTSSHNTGETVVD